MNTDAKDYLESCAFDKTYWGKKIIAAEQRGYFYDIEGMMSNNWVTCACGKVSTNVPRHAEGTRPQDKSLFLLGCKFGDWVRQNDFLSAAKVLVRIENRAVVVARAHLNGMEIS
jgi:hypothetical protein